MIARSQWWLPRPWPATVLAAVVRVALLMGASIVGVPAARAQDVVDHQDAQLWLQLNSQIPVTPSWWIIAEGQPRWNENLTRYDQIALRGGVLHRVTPAVAVAAAYAWVPRHVTGGRVVEHQTYEQVLVTLRRLAAWSPSVRVRLDQRRLRQWGDAAHRLRGQIRLVRPLPRAPTWWLVVTEEVFVNLDHTVRGPARGVDQNRLFGGLQHRLSDHVSVEGGYMWQDLFERGARPQRHNHAAVLQFLVRPQ